MNNKDSSMVADRFDYIKLDAAFEVVQQQLYTQEQ